GRKIGGGRSPVQRNRVEEVKPTPARGVRPAQANSPLNASPKTASVTLSDAKCNESK
ncbi:hypothetical protein SK128_008907, partial [Halocaridina rubra]